MARPPNVPGPLAPYPAQAQTIIRFREDQLQVLERKFPFYMSKETTAIQCAHNAGVQDVLRELRNGYQV